MPPRGQDKSSNISNEFPGSYKLLNIIKYMYKKRSFSAGVGPDPGIKVSCGAKQTFWLFILSLFYESNIKHTVRNDLETI